MQSEQGSASPCRGVVPQVAKEEGQQGSEGELN